jgi:hypothetical protein
MFRVVKVLWLDIFQKQRCFWVVSGLAGCSECYSQKLFFHLVGDSALSS